MRITHDNILEITSVYLDDECPACRVGTPIDAILPYGSCVVSLYVDAPGRSLTDIRKETVKSCLGRLRFDALSSARIAEEDGEQARTVAAFLGIADDIDDLENALGLEDRHDGCVGDMTIPRVFGARYPYDTNGFVDFDGNPEYIELKVSVKGSEALVTSQKLTLCIENPTSHTVNPGYFFVF